MKTFLSTLAAGLLMLAAPAFAANCNPVHISPVNAIALPTITTVQGNVAAVPTIASSTVQQENNGYLGTGGLKANLLGATSVESSDVTQANLGSATVAINAAGIKTLKSSTLIQLNDVSVATSSAE